MEELLRMISSIPGWLAKNSMERLALVLILKIKHTGIVTRLMRVVTVKLSMNLAGINAIG